MKSLYLIHPVFSRFDLFFFRIGGPGFANLMIIYMKSLIIKRQNRQCWFIKPIFKQLKIGPLFRKEKDLRLYGNIGFRRNLIDFVLLVIVKTGIYRAIGINLISVDTLGNLFSDLMDHRTFLTRWFKNKFRHVIRRNIDYSGCIALHLRRGDFSPFIEADDGFNVQLPDSYYQNALANIKAEYPEKKVVLFSDEDSPIIEFFDQIDIVDDSASALDLLIKMHLCDVVICSRSSLSLLAVFLGGGIGIVDSAFEYSRYYPFELKRVCLN